MNKSLLSLAVVSALSLGFTGCGSSSDSSPTVLEGTFIDAPVFGLSYKTATQSGFTNASGKFKYVAGETVEFKLGNLSFGTVTAGSIISPYTMAGDTNTSAPSAKATNIAMLLQSFDSNRSNSGMLDLSKLKDYTFTDVNLSVTTSDMTTKLSHMFADNNFSSYRDTTTNNTPVSASNANSEMKTYVDSVINTSNDDTSTTYKIYNIHNTTNLDLAAATSWVATNHSDLANNKVETTSTNCATLGYSTDVTPSGDTTGGTFYSKTSSLDGNEYCVEWTHGSGSNNYLVSSTGRVDSETESSSSSDDTTHGITLTSDFVLHLNINSTNAGWDSGTYSSIAWDDETYYELNPTTLRCTDLGDFEFYENAINDSVYVEKWYYSNTHGSNCVERDYENLGFDGDSFYWSTL